VRVAVELERPVAAVKGIGRVGLGGVKKASPEPVLDAVRERVEEVDGDAERVDGRDRRRQERDRPLGDGVRGLAEQEPAAGVGRQVADGEFLVGPGASEMAVGPAEVDHWIGSMTGGGGSRVVLLTPTFGRRAGPGCRGAAGREPYLAGSG